MTKLRDKKFFSGFISSMKKRSSFMRPVLVLMAGTGLAQAIPVLLSPVLSRIYSAASFGLFTTYSSILSVIAIIACARYELAIVSPKEDEEAANIWLLAISVSFILACLCGLGILVMTFSGLSPFGLSKLGSLAYLLPLGILTSGFTQASNYWNNRKGRFSVISGTKVSQSTGGTAAQITIGLTTSWTGGLVVGTVIGQTIGSLGNLIAAFWRDGCFRFKMSWSAIRAALRQYKVFPLVSSIGALLNSLAVQMPVFFMFRTYSAEETGFFGMMYKVIALPLDLIAGSISDVLLQRVSSLARENQGGIRRLLLKTIAVQAFLAGPMVIIMNLFGGRLFAFVFGSDWEVAGKFAAILSFSMATRFLVSPLSCLLALKENIKKASAWQLIYFCTMNLLLILAVRFPINNFLIALAVHDVVFYMVYFIIIMFSATKMDRLI